MKIQCNACEAAEAKVLCCADEAALCWDCDEKVHAANKLAGKHQRVPLASPSSVPKCDICQEASGFFFCLEDRALFCRNCDVAIHTANTLVSAHRRFLLTGVQVGNELPEPVSKEQSNSAERIVEFSSKSFPDGSSSYPASGESNEVNKSGYISPNKVSFPGGTMDVNLPDWPLDDLFGFNDFTHSYGFNDNGSAKADSGKIGSSEGSPCFPADEMLDSDGFFGQVPEIPSPPTASGLHWQRNLNYGVVDHTAFVPDIYTSYSIYGIQPNTKRRRPS